MAAAEAQALDFYRQDIQAAIARAAELRALHAALIPGGLVGSPSAPRLPEAASPSHSRAPHQLFAEDYPVFAPNYEEEPLSAYRYLHSRSQGLLETSSETGLERDGKNGKEDLFDDEKEINLSSMSRQHQKFPTTDSQNLCKSSCTNHAALQEPSPGPRRSGSEESEVVTACNRCKPATISRVADFEHKNYRNNSIATSHASGTRQSSFQLPQSKKGAVFSWLVPRFLRKPKSKISPKILEPEDKSEVVKDRGIRSVETLKKELIDATDQNRDAAFAEAGEMRSSLQELKEKVMHLEAYCKELKAALKQAMQGKHNAQLMEKHNLTKRTKSVGSSRGCSMPVSHEVMLEGFLQIVAEARLSVKHFCKTLISLTEEVDRDLLEKLNAHVQSNNLTVLNSRCSKGLQYHLESLVNQTLYQDFENCVFQTNGAKKILDPQQCCLENFSAFVALRSLSWKEVLNEGSAGYSEDLSRFCGQKMSSVVSLLDWSGPWPEQLRQSFFVAAKCVWLLHLLAFSFSPPLAIFRVEENRGFDPLYMEDILLDRQRIQALDHVKVMVMPGFYVQDRVIIRCTVVCNYRSVG